MNHEVMMWVIHTRGLAPLMFTLLTPIMFTPSARLLHKSYAHLINLVSLTGILRRYIILTIKIFARGSTTNRKTQQYHGTGQRREVAVKRARTDCFSPRRVANRGPSPLPILPCHS